MSLKTAQCSRCGTSIVWHWSKTKQKSYPCNSDDRRDFHHCTPKPETTETPPILPVTLEGGESMESPRSENLENLSRAELQARANAISLRPDGSTGKGASGWRATASKEALKAALEAFRNGETLELPEAPKPSHEAPDALAEALRRAMAEVAPKAAPIDAETVREIVQAEIKSSGAGALTVQVAQPTGEIADVGRVHPKFPDLLAFVAARKNVWLVGPAGSGKTTAARGVSKALTLPFGSISVGPQTTQSAIFGFVDAGGTYRETEFRRRYQFGGVFVIDEIDRGSAGVLTCLNQAIENGECGFPDAMVERHPDFVLIACANTYGIGASRQYVGALQIDAATLDRFAFLEWPYDEALELDIARAVCVAAGGTHAVAEAWTAKVQKYRAACERLAIRHIVSPRASINGSEMLARGMSQDHVTQSYVFKGLDADATAKLVAAVQ